ncbi:MAG: iron-sulfur cluster repair di-iron protein [Phycisphaerales bacterium]|nr:iron-sulfur cluster repair di-iron protein [Phycisphaerales bacterium]
MTVGDIVRDHPATARVFEALGVDYCCGGKSPLARAIAPSQLGDTLERLLEAAAEPGPDDSPRWARATMTALADHIEATHHASLRAELPRVAALVEKVFNAHASKDPRLEILRREFRLFSADLLSHMRKEEEVLFPAIRALEAGQAAPMSLDHPIAVMIHEHDDAGAALARMSELTDRFTPPAGACPTWMAMLGALRDIERDMHTHVHKENSILFPAAMKAAGRTGPVPAGGCGGACGCGGRHRAHG